MEEKNTFEKIYDVVRQIPRGTVATYGQVAELAGNRHWSRVVGYALHANPDPDGRIQTFNVFFHNPQPLSIPLYKTPQFLLT